MNLPVAEKKRIYNYRFQFNAVEETNLLEEHMANMPVINGQVRNKYKPYEVKTMRLQK